MGWLALALIAAAAAPAKARVEGYAGIEGTVVRFATVAQGRAVLGTVDEWAGATSDFQRAAILGVAPPVTPARLLEFTVETVKPWSAPDEARWRNALDLLAPRFAALRVPLPPEVLFVNTDGRDVANAPYTRANAVMLPMVALRDQAGDMRSDVVLVAHDFSTSRHDTHQAWRASCTRRSASSRSRRGRPARNPALLKRIEAVLLEPR